MNTSQVIALFGQQNFDNISAFLTEHYLQDYSQDEVLQLVKDLNGSEEEIPSDEISDAISDVDFDWIDVTSTSAAAIRFNPESEYLDIRFNSNAPGAYYRYLDVPQSLFDFMIQIKDDGGSIGSFIAKNVRCEFSNMLVAA